MRKLFFSILLMLLVPMVAGAQEPYAALSYSVSDTRLTFYYDDQKAERNGMYVGTFSSNDLPSWYGQRGSITSVIFDDSFADCTTLTSTAYWFYDLYKLTSIIGISNLKTDNVTDMEEMFRDCSSLTSLDLSGFKTDNVTNMSGMFWGCRGLTSLDLSDFKTDNVWDMGSMFIYCSGLTSLDVTGFKTDNVGNMNGMFFGCSSLTSLDVTGFKTDNVWGMGSMFRDCSSLTSLDLSGFKTDKVTAMGEMFYGCSGLTSLDLSGFKTDNVTGMGLMFAGCSGLTSLDLSGFKTDNVTDMVQMFINCSGLTSLDVTGFKTDNVTDMEDMFRGCSSLTTIYAGDGWSTANIEIDLSYLMFEGCTSLVGGAGTPYDPSHIDHTYARIDGGSDNPGYFTAKGGAQQPDAAEPYAVLSDDNRVLTFYYDDQKTERNGMDVGPFDYHHSPSWYDQRLSITSVVFDNSFAGCTTLTSTAYWFFDLYKLTSITGISNLQTDNVTDMCWMFFLCSSLTSLDVTSFKTDNVTEMHDMFHGCSGLTSLDLSAFNTGNVTDMGSMFNGCRSLTSLDVTGFKTDNVGNMNGMFFGCSSLTSLDVSGFKTDNVTNMGGMFRGCSSLTSLDLTSFKTDNVTTMGSMFWGCSSLTTIYAGDGWSTAKVQGGSGMFIGSTNLVGGAGTPYDDDHTDHTYARIDGGSDNPGYFTRKAGGTEEWTKYDLNGDGKVDAADVVVLVNFIMNQK